MTISPVWITGFEYGVTPNSNGSGLATNISGSPVIESTIKHTGNYSLKIVAPGGGTATNLRKNHNPTDIQIAVARAYFYIPTGGLPSANSTLVGWQIVTAATTVGFNVSSTGFARAQVGGGTAVVGPSISLDTWHYVDIKVNLTATTWTMDWYFDGVAQTQAVLTGQATNDTLQGIRLGSSSTTATYTVYFDDVILSETPADFPIGPGGTELLIPNGAGSSNSGSGILKDAGGTDVDANAYQAINSVPMGNANNYIKQVANGNTNYAGFTFSDISAPHSAILGSCAILCYTSATTTANRGGCIVTKDNFATFNVLRGYQAFTEDYSDGSTASPYWKIMIVDGANTDSTVNALQMRLGYSDDASPNPYWLDIAIEVAYVPSSNVNDDLNLVTYTYSYLDINILESTLIPLDKPSFSSTFPTLNVLENTVVPLDKPVYSSTFPDINVIENVVIRLDLVTYGSTQPAITILESIIEHLNLVTFNTVIPDITVIENTVIQLDSVSYTDDFPSLSLLENIVLQLDSVSIDSVFGSLTVLENEIVQLDLVNYLLGINDLSVLENEVSYLDLVSYISDVHDVELHEPSHSPLEPVLFTSYFPPIGIIEDERIELDLVTYSFNISDLLIEESEIIVLDSVSYTSVVNAILVMSSDSLIKTPLKRIFSIDSRLNYLVISKQNRRYSISRQIRIL